MSSRLMIPFGAALCALCLSFAAAPAFAQTDPGRIHFQAGASDYESGDYEHALNEFQRAYELSQRKQLFYNIALSYQQLGDLEHAVEFLGRYLSEVESIPNRAALERRQANLQRRLDAQRAEAAAAAAAANATQTNATDTADTATDVTATDNTATDVTATDNTATDVTATDNTATDNTATDNTATDVTTDEPSDHASGGGANVAAITSFVGGGVGLAMAVAFGAMAVSEQNRVDGLPCAITATCDSVPGANPGTMDTYALLSDVGTGIAIVGVGLGLVFLLTADDDDEQDPTQARIHMAPFAGPNTAGLAAQGSF